MIRMLAKIDMKSMDTMRDILKLPKSMENFFQLGKMNFIANHNSEVAIVVGIKLKKLFDPKNSDGQHLFMDQIIILRQMKKNTQARELVFMKVILVKNLQKNCIVKRNNF